MLFRSGVLFTRKNRVLRAVLRVYLDFIRVMPQLVLLFLVFFGSASSLGLNFSGEVASVIVFTAWGAAELGDLVRAALEAIPQSQYDGAFALGLTSKQTFARVILPQALRNILPQVGNNLIINIKDTSVMSIIGFSEFFDIHKSVVGTTYKYFPSAAIEMVVYLSMTLLASFLLRMWEKKMDGAGSYKLVETDSLTMTAGTYSHPDKDKAFAEQSKEYREEN